MVQYTKKHSKKEAAEGHVSNIKARGGKASMKYSNAIYLVTYSFPVKTKFQTGGKVEKDDFFDSKQREWDYARISSGRYQTSGYLSKEYSTKAGLKRGLKSYGYPSKHPYNGETWNSGGKKYEVSFDYK